MRQLQNIVMLAAALLSVGAPALAQYQEQYPGQGAMPPSGYGRTMPAAGYPQGMPMQQQFAGGPPPQVQQPGQFGGQQPQQMQAPSNGITVPQWFMRYDQIRREAQMSPVEKQQADSLMSRGLSILVPGENKIATKQLLGMMVGRYQRACAQLQALPQIQPTSQLHVSYFNYFNTAATLFNDYVRVQDNLFLTDATTGAPMAAGLLQRKQMLEMLEGRCKQMDAATRQQFGIPPYQY
jgi:hypothetical protein